VDPEVAGLLRVFDSLSQSKQVEAVQRLNEYIEGSALERQRIIGESQGNRIAKVDLGPVSSVCPYCGR
jgi:hypothetical protein